MVPAPTGKGSVIVPSPTPTRDLDVFRYQLNTLKAQNTLKVKRESDLHYILTSSHQV